MPVPLLPSLVPAQRPPLALCAVVLLIAACNPQASTKYRGEPLLTMSGSVELALESTSGELSPALAFLNRERAEIEIIDVEAQGEFPAEFTIRVYDPPPRSAFFPILNDSMLDDEQAPAAALAFITAVTPSHADQIRFADNQEISHRPSLCNGGPCACPESGCVRSENKLCTNDGETCFVEKVTCPQSDSPEEECSTEYSGDPSVGDNPWKSFAGLSENYAIVYVDHAIEARSPAALALGTRDALEPGYTLLSIHRLTQQEAAEAAECAEAAGALALERFNREHDTDYDELTIVGLGCGPNPSDPALCPQPASSEEIDAYYALTDAVAAEEGCLQTGYLATRVSDADAEAITIRIGHTLDPLSEGGAAQAMTQSASPISTPNPGAP